MSITKFCHPNILLPHCETEKEWAKPVAALLPPGGSAGSRNRKEFPGGAVSGS